MPATPQVEGAKFKPFRLTAHWYELLIKRRHRWWKEVQRKIFLQQSREMGRRNCEITAFDVM